MNTLLQIETEKQIAETVRIREDNESGRIEWGRAADTVCTYESQVNERLHCELQCCGPYVLKLNGKIVKVPQDLLDCLCEIIKEKIALRESQEITQMLQSIKPQ